MTERERFLVGTLAQAMEQMDQAGTEVEIARKHRDDVIVALREIGWAGTDCAEITGLSLGQIHNIGKAAGLTVDHRRRS